MVELLIPELWDAVSGNVMEEQGDQARMWELTREFNDQLVEQLGGRVKAVYPDAGAQALLQSTWGENKLFELSSLNEPDILEGDDISAIVLACPDPPSADKAIRVTRLPQTISIANACRRIEWMDCRRPSGGGREAAGDVQSKAQ